MPARTTHFALSPPPPLSCLSFISLRVPSPSPCVICPDGRCVGSVSCERPSLIQGAARVVCKRSRWSICLGPPPSMTCKSLLISVQGIEVLDLIFLAAKKNQKTTSQELPLCVCVCACMSAAQCFLLAFLTGSWCWVQLRTGKRPFLSSVNHLRQREKNRRARGEGRGGEGAKSPGCCIDSALCNLSFLSLSSLSAPIDYSSFIFSLFVQFSPQLHSRAEGICGFTGSSWAVWEDQGGTESKWSRTLWGAKLPVLLVHYEAVYFFALKWRRKP